MLFKEIKTAIKKYPLFSTAYIVFWTGFVVFFTIYQAPWVGYLKSFFSSLSNGIFYFVLIHVHAFYLLPLFKEKKNLLKYFLLTAVLLIALTIFSNTTLYYVYNLKLVISPANISRVAFTLASGVIALVISTAIKYAYDYFQLKAREQELIKMQLETEMKYLKMQINPHFLFNTLNNLYYLTKEKSDLAPKVVEQLAGLMRYMLENTEKNDAYLKTEIGFLESYLELEKIRIPQVDILFDISGEIKNYKVPPLILLTLTENAFKHGINKTSDSNFVKINLKTSDDKLFFRVENPVVERHFKTTTTVTGINNLKKRLDLLFNNNYELKTGVNGSKTFVSELIMPLVK